MSPRILVVDDEHLIAETVRYIFSAHGYVAECASSGEEAIAIAGALHPDLLLADVMMRGLNGFETALQVKELCPHCRLLFFSADAATEALAQSFQKVFAERGYHFEVLPKPMYPSTLLNTVEKALQVA
jgi:CheY-like chemotaxis protein